MDKCICNNRVVSDGDVSLSRDSLDSILGKDDSVLSLYKKGSLGSLIDISMSDIFEEKALGSNVKGSSVLYDAIRGIYGIAVKYRNLSSSLGNVHVYFCSGRVIGLGVLDAFGKSFVERFKNSGGITLSKSIIGCDYSDEDRNTLCRCVGDIIDYVSGIVDVSIYSIEYFTTECESIDSVGSGSLYLGYSACMGEEFDSCLGGNSASSYSIIFLEDY